MIFWPCSTVSQPQPSPPPKFEAQLFGGLRTPFTSTPLQPRKKTNPPFSSNKSDKMSCFFMLGGCYRPEYRNILRSFQICGMPGCQMYQSRLEFVLFALDSMNHLDLSAVEPYRSPRSTMGLHIRHVYVHNANIFQSFSHVHFPSVIEIWGPNSLELWLGTKSSDRAYQIWLRSTLGDVWLDGKFKGESATPSVSFKRESSFSN